MGRHHLNAAVLGVVTCFLFAALFLAAWSPRELGGRMLGQIGAVGVSLGVSPNPDNILAAQLREREASLSAREDALRTKENEIAAEFARRDANTLEYSFLGGSLLIALILLNIYFDYLAMKGSAPRPASD